MANSSVYKIIAKELILLSIEIYGECLVLIITYNMIIMTFVKRLLVGISVIIVIYLIVFD